LILPWRFVVTCGLVTRDGAIAGKFERVFSDGKSELRYIRNHLWQASRSAILGVDNCPQTLKNSTWCDDALRTSSDQVGNLYGRNWVEYGLKQRARMSWAGQTSASQTIAELSGGGGSW